MRSGKMIASPRVYTRKDPRDRFATFFEKGSPDECWLWKGKTIRAGYGRFAVSDKPRVVVSAHRYAAEVEDADVIVHHRCGNKLCVNPAHLELLRQGDHARLHMKGALKGTHCKNGHPFDGHNGKQQTCRTCLRRSSREFQRRKRAAQD